VPTKKPAEPARSLFRKVEVVVQGGAAGSAISKAPFKPSAKKIGEDFLNASSSACGVLRMFEV
jgi:hypothetical protein